jgi:hypothetical protein
VNMVRASERFLPRFHPFTRILCRCEVKLLEVWHLLESFLEQALSLLKVPLVDVANGGAVQEVRSLEELLRQLLVDVVGVLDL